MMPGYPKFCVYRQSTWVCVIAVSGAYECPTHADDGSPLRNRNAATDKRGVLKLDVRLKGTHAPPPLAWQRRYAPTDGFIDPWTPAGKLRRGLTLTPVAKEYRGHCDRGSEQTVAKSAIRCWADVTFYLFDPCFPRTRDWNRRGALVACASPGATAFARFMVFRRS